MAFSCGNAYGWSSPVLPRLNGNQDPQNNPLEPPISPQEESWIASLLPLGSAFGPLIAPLISDSIGRKKTLLLIAVPMIVSHLMTAFSHVISLFYIARLILGVGAGSAFSLLPNYLAEISEKHNRGQVGCLMGVSVASGLLFSYTVGPFLTVKYFGVVCVLPLLIFLAVFGYFIPESPQFLALKNNESGTERSLMKLRQKSRSEVQKELQEIKKSVLEFRDNQGGLRDLLSNRGLRKGLIVSTGLMILQQFAGINVVLSYMQSIFDATGTGLAPETSTIIIGLVQMGVTIVTSSLVDRLGRRILFLISATGSCISLISLGLYFYLKEHGNDVSAISWLPILSLLVYIICFNLGLGPLPWAVMGELFPPNVKGVASAITGFICFMGAFLMTLFFPSLSLFLGRAQSFWCFSLVAFGGIFFIYWVLPETKGRSLQEILLLLEGRGSK